MKLISKISKIVPILFLAFGFYACSDDDDNGGDDPIELSIVETAIATENLSSLVAALQQAGLVDTLNGGPFTVLAPTNTAFDTFLAANGFAALSEVPNDLLTQVLLNHVIDGEVLSTDLTTAGAGYTNTNATGAGGNDMSLYFNTSSGVTFNGASSVDVADVEASNGIVHIVDAVISLPSVVDHALANSSFSSLVAALGAADGDLVNVVSGDGPFTVLAPDNTAFNTFLDGTPLDQVDTAVLSQLLLNHVLGGVTLASDLSAAGSGYTNTSASGPQTLGMEPTNLSLYFNVGDEVTFNGISDVTQADVVGTNGVIHAVDRVIELPTVVDFALADANFSSLVAALTTADAQTPSPALISTLSGEGPFTVFAPVDTAFQALLDSNMDWNTLADIDVSLLTTVLTHHVSTIGNVVSDDLTDGLVAPMFNGQNITINLPGNDDNPAKITDGAGNTDIDIIAVDVQAANGVIHAVETVLLPADE